MYVSLFDNCHSQFKPSCPTVHCVAPNTGRQQASHKKIHLVAPSSCSGYPGSSQIALGTYGWAGHATKSPCIKGRWFRVNYKTEKLQEAQMEAISFQVKSLSYSLQNGFQACINSGSFIDRGDPERERIQAITSTSLENMMSELFPVRCSTGYNDSCVPHIQP